MSWDDEFDGEYDDALEYEDSDYGASGSNDILEESKSKEDFDPLDISNPGRIYGNLTIEDLKRDDYVSSIRNKLLAEAFYMTGDIEKYGTGFVRIREMLKDYPEV